jgi:hypothetical protein
MNEQTKNKWKSERDQKLLNIYIDVSVEKCPIDLLADSAETGMTNIEFPQNCMPLSFCESSNHLND